jgi:hypothetical protein
MGSRLNPQLLAGGDPCEIYKIGHSVRFNSVDGPRLERTLGVGTNAKKGTLALWPKLSKTGTDRTIFSAGATATTRTAITFNQSDQFQLIHNSGGGYYGSNSAAAFRDLCAHLPIIVAWDTTLATAADRVKLWIGDRPIALAAYSLGYIPQNADLYFGQAVAAKIGAAFDNSIPFDGYLSEVHFVDGQALDPSYFGITCPTTGQWRPKRYTGTYGANGYHLDFSDGSAATSAALGKDRSGNNNDWTPTNISVAAGVGCDWVEDTPSNNFATFNPLRPASSVTYVYSEGNLKVAVSTSGAAASYASIVPKTGKIVSEFRYVAPQSGGNLAVGFGNSHILSDGTSSGLGGFSGAAWSLNDNFSIEVDVDAVTMTIYRNGSLYMSSRSYSAGSLYGDTFYCMTQNGGAIVANFGQMAFGRIQTVGYKPLCTANLPVPAIKLPKRHFDVVTRTGTGAAYTKSGLPFGPGIVWPKCRSAAYDNKFYDIVRGVTKQISSNNLIAEGVYPQSLTAFNTDGYSLGTDAVVNELAKSYVDWVWKAGGAGVANNDGSIASVISANPEAGISVVAYTGTGAAGTVGHGMGKTPMMVITFCRSAGSVHRKTWHAGLAGGTYELELSNTVGQANNSSFDGAPNSTTFGLGVGPSTNTLGNTYVAICFAEVPGFSKFGSYAGNGAVDGPFVWTGLLARWLLIKRIDAASATGWFIWDTQRGPYNTVGPQLYSNLNAQESSYSSNLDIVSNGFKIRDIYADLNANGGSYIYAAFAEFPFKYANAR